MKVAVVGATGMVGTVMLKVLEERNLPITEFIPVASERSAGKKLSYKGKEYTIVTPAETDNFEDWIEYIEDRPFNDKRYYISNTKLKKLGWSVEIDIDQGLELLIK